MRSYDYEAYVHDGSVYCANCGPGAETEDAHPIFADSEWEYYPVCDECGAEHDYVILLGEEG